MGGHSTHYGQVVSPEENQSRVDNQTCRGENSNRAFGTHSLVAPRIRWGVLVESPAV